jgi:hypothetical protein
MNESEHCITPRKWQIVMHLLWLPSTGRDPCTATSLCLTTFSLVAFPRQSLPGT